MRLRCLTGAYAGQIRDYSTAVGLTALRTGAAARLDTVSAPPVVGITVPAIVATVKPVATQPTRKATRR